MKISRPSFCNVIKEKKQKQVSSIRDMKSIVLLIGKQKKTVSIFLVSISTHIEKRRTIKFKPTKQTKKNEFISLFNEFLVSLFRLR